MQTETREKQSAERPNVGRDKYLNEGRDKRPNEVRDKLLNEGRDKYLNEARNTDLHREICETIARAGEDFVKLARTEDIGDQLDSQFNFLRHLMGRREVIRSTMRPRKIEFYRRGPAAGPLEGK